MKDSNIHVIELSEYTRPEIKEERNKDWVTIGDDNNFFGYLIDRYLNSPTNHSIINGIVAQIYGKGLNAFDSNRKIDQFAAMKSLFKKQDLKRLILDLKVLGMGALQITYKGKKVDKVTHFPMDTLRPEKMNDKGVIEAWYYHPNWAKYKRSDKPDRIPAYGTGKPNEIYIVSKYIPSMNYFNLCDWFGSVSYCELEEKVSDYLLNTVSNSFSASKLISFNGGIPERQKQMEIKNDVIRKLTSQHGDKLIVSFNQSKETAPEVIDLPIPNAADTYQYLSEECSRKIMIGHRVTSPLLIGLRDGNSSLGSNADEIVNASRLFTNVTIKPYQDQIIECLEEIMSNNGISLDLYFKSLEPLEFREVKDEVITEEQEENMTTQLSVKNRMGKEQEQTIIECLEEYGEDLNEEQWELIDESPAGSHEDEAKLDEVMGFAMHFNDVPDTAKPNEKSTKNPKQEEAGLYKLRYSYEGAIGDNTRAFCKAMIKRNNGKKYGHLYRKEDIDKLSSLKPNKGMGINGGDYVDIFTWKGGPRCKHNWRRRIFFRKRGSDGKILPASKSHGMENDRPVGNVPNVRRKGQEGQKNSDRADQGFKN